MSAAVSEALDEEPILVVTGARQAGKTTLVRDLAEAREGSYRTLDDPDVLAAARADPASVLEGPPPVCIDEFQRVPELLLAIKQRVDRDRTPGAFVLTGSSRYLTLPTVSESLAGRAVPFELWPFSAGEIVGRRERFVDALFAGEPALGFRGSEPSPDYLAIVCTGGFPLVVERSARSRARWFEAYVTTVTRRDVLEITRVRRIADLARLLRLAAARTASVLNTASLANDAGMPLVTCSDYLTLLEAVYLVHRVPAWSTNLTAKVARHPKLHLTDSGLAAHLMGVDPVGARIRAAAAFGPLVETYVVNEIAKQLGWSETRARMFHFRDRSGVEVDLVLEAPDGRVAAIEVKAGTRVDAADCRGLELLRDRLGKAFVCGVVLYGGAFVQRRGDRVFVLPLEALWRAG